MWRSQRIGQASFGPPNFKLRQCRNSCCKTDDPRYSPNLTRNNPTSGRSDHPGGKEQHFVTIDDEGTLMVSRRNPQLSGRSQPSVGHRRALALQREGDLPARTRHRLIERLAAAVGESGASEQLGEFAWLLLDQARIVEGEQLPDPAAFARRLAALLERGLPATA
jgi:hypothetical protein